MRVARIHRQNCTQEFDSFDVATGASEINRLTTFITNTTSDYTLVGLAAGVVKGYLYLLNDTFHSLGITKITDVNGAFTFTARPGFPNDTDYIIAQAVHDYAEQFVTILPPSNISKLSIHISLLL